MNTLTTSNLEKKGLFNLRVYCFLWREIRAGTQCRNLKAGSEAKQWRTAVCWLLIHLAFLYKDLCTVSWALPLQSVTRKHLTDLPTGRCDGDISSLRFFFPDTCRLVSGWQNPAHLASFVLDDLLMSYWLCYSKAKLWNTKHYKICIFLSYDIVL